MKFIKKLKVKVVSYIWFITKVKKHLMHREYLNELRANGLTVGTNFSMQSGCIIDESHCFQITIGDNVTLAPNVHLLAHDASTKFFTGYTRLKMLAIGNNVFNGAGSIVLPGAHIGDNTVIGAGSVVSRPCGGVCLQAILRNLFAA